MKVSVPSGSDRSKSRSPQGQGEVLPDTAERLTGNEAPEGKSPKSELDLSADLDSSQYLTEEGKETKTGSGSEDEVETTERMLEDEMNDKYSPMAMLAPSQKQS